MRDAREHVVQSPLADTPCRRAVLLSFVTIIPASLVTTIPAAHADDFHETPTGLRILDLRQGEGPVAGRGDTVIVDWAGYTKGYQGKRIDNTSARDEPFIFTIGSGQVRG